MKIHFFETKDWEEEYLRKQITGHDLVFSSGVLSEDTASGVAADIVSVFVGSRITAKVLDTLPGIKCIATRSTGTDHIDLSATQARGVVVSNVPTYGEHTVAEFTFALMLMLSRKMYPAVKRVREQGVFNFEGLQGFDLQGKILGVIGTGHIGSKVIKIAIGFGMDVLAFDVHPNKKLSDDFDFEYVSLEDVLKQSDIITLHVPYLPATHHLLNKENMRYIKPGSMLVNTARGALIETESLVEALASGRLAGAGLDVLEQEGYIADEIGMLLSGHPNQENLKTLLADSALMRMENVIVTPHNAFNTAEAVRQILDTTVDNIASFIKGKPKNLAS